MIDIGTDVSVTVSEFVDLLNETYEFAFPRIVITGELANLRVSKNKWLYFDLKDETASVKFFGSVYNLPGPLENGMLLHVRGTPRMHSLYGFSVTVQHIQAAGEGSIRRAAELLQAKLQAEGLFDAERKRRLPYPPERIGLITSAQSAAYADFVKILGNRWGSMQIDLIDVQVQGEAAPAQIIAALNHFNTMAEPPEVIVLIRGGGSADDLAAWSHESVTRAVGSSRVPTLVAIGHEVDTSLAELAADRRASTPSNAAEVLTPDKQVVLENLQELSERLYDSINDYLYEQRQEQISLMTMARHKLEGLFQTARQDLQASSQLLEILSPQAALRRGYAIVRNEAGKVIGGATEGAVLPAAGAIVRIELYEAELEARVNVVHENGVDRKMHK